MVAATYTSLRRSLAARAGTRAAWAAYLFDHGYYTTRTNESAPLEISTPPMPEATVHDSGLAGAWSEVDEPDEPTVHDSGFAGAWSEVDEPDEPDDDDAWRRFTDG